MTFRTQIVALAAIPLALLLIVVALGIGNANRTDAVLDDVVERQLPLSSITSAIATTQAEQAIWLQRGVTGSQLGDVDAVSRAIDTFAQLNDANDANFAAAEKLIKQGEMEEFYGITARYAEFKRGGKEFLELLEIGGTGLVNSEARLAEANRLVTTTGEALRGFNEEAQQDTGMLAREVGARSHSARQYMTLAGIAALVLGLLTTLVVGRNMENQLGADPSALLDLSNDLAHGRLNSISADSNQVKRGAFSAISDTVKRLREVVAGIKGGASQVSAASTQVMAGNTDLSSRTQEQASSLEEIAASMEEMTGTVTQNADNAQQAEKLARQAREQASTGSEVVSEAVTAMDMINDSSSRIAEILDLIEDIAFQTNLLALNAAVEAARAGENGRGFAVVAAEVRNLAGRSSAAAKDIKSLIQESTKHVDNGTRLVNNSGAKLHEIVSAVKGVSDIVSEIASASLEQSDGIAQVNKAVMQMESMTQQNAALVEQAAAASQSMGEQASELERMVAFFQLEDEAISDEPTAEITTEAGEVETAAEELDEEIPTAEPIGEDDAGEWTRF